MAISEESNHSEDEKIWLFNTTNNIEICEYDEYLNSNITDTSSMFSLYDKNCDDSSTDDNTSYDEAYPDDFTFTTMKSKISSLDSSIPYDIDLTIPWDNQSDTKAVNSINTAFPNNNVSQLLSDEDLEMIARNLYMRKQELEAVSYPNIVEDDTFFFDYQIDIVDDDILFYDCTNNSQINDDDIHSIPTHFSTPTHPIISQYWPGIVNNTHTDTQNFKNEQSNTPDNYEDSLQWCNLPYCTNKYNDKPFHLSINHTIAALQHKKITILSNML